MRLRKRRTVARALSPSYSPLPRTPKSSRKRQQVKEEDELCHTHKSSTKKQPAMQTRSSRKKKSYDENEGFKTPVRDCSLKVRFDTDCGTPESTVARNIYSPIVKFLTPMKVDTESPSPLKSDTEMHSFVEYKYMASMTTDEEDGETFDPYDFVKNIRSQSEPPSARIRDIPVKTRSTPEATLLLDLDETLVYSSLSAFPDAQHSFFIHFQDHEYKVYLNLRPFVSEFLERMSQIYEIFVYTSAKKEYGEKILEIMDPHKKLIRHRLYQEDCFCVQGHYIKDLAVLKRDLAKAVIVDNNPYTWPYQLTNVIPIQSWYGNQKDRELQKLVPYLEKLSTLEDFRVLLKKRADQLQRLLSED
ncbi:CTD small phosphatase-like protein 2-A isoform X1 [Erpetoichthys calabaricus]|uniref:CTD small phosphatase-like protein 2-A n=2 Tax=Erpetoichthys calabaricus TaxID=27687 RepID=A0A8C4XBQ0_ERPCA|nr:CTD small phosphatase-like protein 2-A isoform X1 [Erpetoichthys calabaricus]